MPSTSLKTEQNASNFEVERLGLVVAVVVEERAQLLERRLDNVVFRAGFAPTIPAARQLVNHRHFTVNGQRVNIPSIRVNVGDVIEVRESSKKVQVIVDSLAAGGSLRSPDWVEVEGEAMKVKVSALPEGAETAPFELDIQQVIEFYSRRL